LKWHRNNDDTVAVAGCTTG